MGYVSSSCLSILSKCSAFNTNRKIFFCFFQLVCFKLQKYFLNYNYFYKKKRAWPNSSIEVKSSESPVYLKQLPSLEERPPYGFPVWDPRVNFFNYFL